MKKENRLESIKNFIIENKRHVILLFYILLILICLFTIFEYQKGKPESIEILIFILSLISVFITIFSKKVFLESKYSSQYRQYLINELWKESDQVLQNIKKQKGNEKQQAVFHYTIGKGDNKDIIALMLRNHDEINEYFKISKSQAKASFWLSFISCIFGIIALFFGIYSAIFMENISISIISIISASVSEVIAATVFWVHNKSALQLNHYYNALHENEKFLSAVNMAEKLNEENRENMIMDIIRNQITVCKDE